VRIEAVDALLRLGTPEAEAQIQEFLADEKSWRRRRQIRGAVHKFRMRQGRWSAER